MSGALEDFERFLNQQRDPIELLLTQLTPEQAATLRLSAIPHSFDEATLAVLEPALDAAALKARMAFLTELSVVVHAGNDLALHDRARRVLFDDWLATRRDAFATVSRRLADHYLDLSADLPETEREVCQSRGVYHLIGADQAEGIRQLVALFRASHASLRTGNGLRLIALALDYAAILTPAARTTIRLLEGMAAARLNNPADARAAFDAVAQDGTPDQQVEALRRAAQLAREGGDLPAANAYLRRAQWLIDSAPIDRSEGVRVHLEFGLLLRDQEQIEEARNVLEQAARQADKAYLPIERAAALNALGRTLGRLGDYSAAIAHYRHALRVLSGDMMVQRSAILSNLATAAADAQDFALAEQSFGEALAMARASHDGLGEATIEGNLARVLWRGGRKQEATATATAAAAKLVELGHTDRAAVVLLNLARLHRNGGDPAARIHAAEAARLQRAIGNEAVAAQIDADFAADIGGGSGCRWWLFILLIVAVFAAFVGLLVVVIAKDAAG